MLQVYYNRNWKRRGDVLVHHRVHPMAPDMVIHETEVVHHGYGDHPEVLQLMLDRREVEEICEKIVELHRSALQERLQQVFIEMERDIFHVPPENQGQIVEVAYAAVGGHVVERTHDRSDGSTRYSVSKMLADDQGEYWNGAPRNKRWKPISERQFEDLCKS